MYNNAMENSVAERFTSDNGGIDCINCMCHSTENLYRYHATSVARASEDFFPDRSDSQTVHIVNVAYNSLFLGEICLPDWDMFHSLHEYAPLHAAARAVGGCPVYVSDKPGRHDANLLRKLVMPDGTVLRANLPGRPTRDCLFANVGTDKVSALKIWNQNNVGGVVGAFHVQGVEWNFDTHENEVVEENPAPLTATVTPKDVESLRGKEGPFCAWRHQSATLEFLENDSSEMKAELNHREWEIFSIVPVQTTGDVMWGPIGLANMMNSGGGLLHADEPLEQTTTITADGLTATATAAGLSARGPGLFVGYCQPAPTRVLIDGTTVTELQFDHDEQTGKLSFQLPEENSQRDAHRLTVVWDQLD
jgi:raffinose synthase